MFCSNTSTTAMMLPFVLGILDSITPENASEEDKARIDSYGKTVLIGIAWSASAGGIGIIIGTPALSLALSLFAEEFPTAPTISFAKWMLFGFPVSITVTLLAWFLLTRWFMRDSFAIDQQIMVKQYRALPPMTRDEKVVLGVQLLQI